MNTLKYITLSILSVMLLMVSCTSDSDPSTKPATTDQLSGHWDLTSATRNNEKTSSLEGTYMDFSDGKMTCNFTGEELKTEFAVNDNELTHGKQKYKIETLTDSKLVVSTKLSIYDFQLTFSKAKD